MELFFTVPRIEPGIKSGILMKEFELTNRAKVKTESATQEMPIPWLFETREGLEKEMRK